jgi:uncharacterized protein involved in exopolysaccharide biosynthesis
LGHKVARAVPASAARQYFTFAAALFCGLSFLITMAQLWQAPVYSCRSTARVGNPLSMALAGPAALFAADAVEDELAVLESLSMRTYVADELKLACKPVPAWDPNPFVYQVKRITALLTNGKPPLNYSELAYPQVTQVTVDFRQAKGRKYFLYVDGQGNYTLGVGRKKGPSAAVGQPLSGSGLTVALDGFTPGVAQRWALKVTDPERVAVDVLNSLSVFRVGSRSQTIGVRYEDAHPELAARVVSTLMDHYVERDVAITQEVSSESLSYIEEQIDTVQGELDQFRQQLMGLLQDRSSLIASSADTTIPGNYLQLDQQLQGLRTERSQIDALLAQLKSDQGFVGYYEVSPGSRRLESDLVDQIMSTERELQQELQTKTEQHPDVVELRHKLDSQRGDLKELLNESQAQIGREIAATEGQRGKLESLLELTPTASIELERLKGEMLIRSESLGALYGERQKAALQQISSISTIRILDPAVVDREHLRPRVMQSVLTAIIFSLFITAALLLGLRAVDTTLRGPRDLQGRFGLPVLGVLARDGSGGSEEELNRLKLMLQHSGVSGLGKLAVLSTAGTEPAGALAQLLAQLLSGTATDEVPAPQVVAAGGNGVSALYSNTVVSADAVIIATAPGAGRLKALGQLVEELKASQRRLLGFVLLQG